MTRLMRDLGPMSDAAPAFPLATGAVDPARSVFEKQGRNAMSMLWSGEAGALAREEPAGELTTRLWNDARARLSSFSLPG